MIRMRGRVLCVAPAVDPILVGVFELGPPLGTTAVGSWTTLQIDSPDGLFIPGACVLQDTGEYENRSMDMVVDPLLRVTATTHWFEYSERVAGLPS